MTRSFTSSLTLCRTLFITSCLTLILGCDQHQSPSSSYKVANKGLYAAAISDSADTVAVGSILHGGSFWNLDTHERLYNWNHSAEETSTITAIDLSANGHWALTAETHTLVLWNTITGQAERFWTAPGEVLDVELGPDANNALLGLTNHSAVLFNIRRGGILRTFTHQNRVRSVDMSDDGKIAITGSEDYSVTVWDVNANKALYQFKHQDEVQLVKLSADGKLGLSVSKYDRALLWEIKTGKMIGEIPLASQHLKRGLRFTAARFSRDNSLLLTGRPDQIVELWDIASLSKLASWRVPKLDAWKPTSAAIIDVAFKSNNEFIAASSNGYIHTLNYD